VREREKVLERETGRLGEDLHVSHERHEMIRRDGRRGVIGGSLFIREMDRATTERRDDFGDELVARDAVESAEKTWRAELGGGQRGEGVHEADASVLREFTQSPRTRDVGDDVAIV
jgi:hypothetical protein